VRAASAYTVSASPGVARRMCGVTGLPPPPAIALFLRPYLDVHFRQLRVADRRRRAGHQALRRSGLRECDHVADRLGAGHQRGDAVDAEGDATVRGRAIAQRLEQEAEFRLRL